MSPPIRPRDGPWDQDETTGIKRVPCRLIKIPTTSPFPAPTFLSSSSAPRKTNNSDVSYTDPLHHGAGTRHSKTYTWTDLWTLPTNAPASRAEVTERKGSRASTSTRALCSSSSPPALCKYRSPSSSPASRFHSNPRGCKTKKKKPTFCYREGSRRGESRSVATGHLVVLAKAPMPPPQLMPRYSSREAAMPIGVVFICSRVLY